MGKMKFNRLIFCIYLFFTLVGNAQQIPTTKIIENSKLSNYLTEEVKAQLNENNIISEAKLADYLRNKFSERYFFNWKNVDERFQKYNKTYPNIEASHTERALDHSLKYSAVTQWKLPFNYLNGEPVNAYALRHLARQHKMVDIAYYYYYQNKNPKYISYFTNQLKSLNIALSQGKYEKIEGGNGVYEAFRSGYRVLNWLQIYNMFLGEESYTDEDQLITVATLLQHGAHLYASNTKFKSGNHQTRGLSALVMISILLRDFEGTDLWYNHAMQLLEEHLSKEINDDGFQFERSVHYHMSDIGNYYYVYQLAKLSNIKVGDFWEKKLKSLFTTLTKIAYPDKSAPVLQDDTDNPWAEKNDISGVLTLGYLLFKDPSLGYFANNYVASNMYWFLNKKQLEALNSIQKETPVMGSVSFPTTGYYISRDGWNANANMLIISAGLDAFKPDHQHGDMLGVQAMANGNVVLPNYQVRYSLKDYGFFKNSIVKNVALVDDELQGKQYTSNKGGSGFGKFLELPNPKTISWKTNKDYDVFVGSHDGFKNVGVSYSRQVINIKNNFWIVKDNFISQKSHAYKQVWQGHYSLENAPNLLRATFDDATGLDIYQLNKVDTINTDGARGKQWSVVTKNANTNFSFITALFPYKGYENRLDETDENLKLGTWKINNQKLFKSDASTIISNTTTVILFETSKIKNETISIEFNTKADVIISTKNGVTLQNIGDKPIKVESENWKAEKELDSGELLSLSSIKNNF
ncbi:heparinase II/III family protein [Lutibacter sp. A64]|uniref:heparinase II/III family protein n=1 Tax=Lutibacter sp. A64 TaxID=2918526 RepID=UPI001F06B8C8|nr:heparinase II/III family protein [Lutibacter sp. A64]UMB52555.1 heparinase II/III family protein [Lutibacter sp. A64]